MKLFQTIIVTPCFGVFLILAEHEGSKVTSLKVYPVNPEGIVGGVMPNPMEDFPAVILQVESTLAAMEG